MTFIDKISELRGGEDFQIDSSNSNRYRIVIFEKDGTKTAYCFSSPIYDMKKRKLFSGDFQFEGGRYIFYGSNATISIDNNITMENTLGSCRILTDDTFETINNKTLACKTAKITPTVNGVVFICPNMPYTTIQICVDCNIYDIRSNNKSFSVMVEKFKPLFTVSCIGVQNKSGEIIAPIDLSYEKTADNVFSLRFEPQTTEGNMVFEINMHDMKLFQDTTVESAHSKENNAFGGTGFLGQSKSFGEQWLYTRPDWSVIADLMNMSINKVNMHIPKLNNNNSRLVLFSVVARFCSFGSNWNNRIPILGEIGDACCDKNYHSFDITTIVKDTYSQKLKTTPGMIVKPKRQNGEFTVISTADSSCNPQILEINYF